MSDRIYPIPVKKPSKISSWGAWPKDVQATLHEWNRGRDHRLTFVRFNGTFKCPDCEQFCLAHGHGAARLDGIDYCDDCLIALARKESAMSADPTEFMPADKHGEMIAALVYRGVMVCRSCVKPEEHTMSGQFFDWDGVTGSGWNCDRCGTELEHQERP